MEQKNNDNVFSYTYSVDDRAEVEKIREKYVKKTEQENKLELLRRLDDGVTKKAQMISLIYGILGALLLGIGMSLIMTDLSALLGDALSMVVGIIVGIIGGVLICLAYPMYQRTIKRERERIAPRIMELTSELMK